MKEQERLLSLDILRGLDIAILVIIHPVIIQFFYQLNIEEGSWLMSIYNQIEHVEWEGFCCWDMIMPLFMFMSGITIPFSMSKYKMEGGKVDTQFWKRLLRRFIILWVLGMICQGNLLDFNIHTLRLYSNTLQSIATGYLVVAILYVFTSLKTQITVVSFSFLAYIAVFAIWGGMNFAPTTNIAEVIDRNVLGHFMDGVQWDGEKYTFSEHYHYTWILSSLNFIVTVYLGCITGHILKIKTLQPMQKFWRILIEGIILIVLAYALSPIIPINKHIWSNSMTLLAGGYSMILMALTYFVIDIHGWRKGTEWLRWFSMNCLTAYVLHSVVRFKSVVHSFTHGLEQFTGDYYNVIRVAGACLIIFFIIRLMYKHKVFLRA